MRILSKMIAARKARQCHVSTEREEELRFRIEYGLVTRQFAAALATHSKEGRESLNKLVGKPPTAGPLRARLVRWLNALTLLLGFHALNDEHAPLVLPHDAVALAGDTLDAVQVSGFIQDEAEVIQVASAGHDQHTGGQRQRDVRSRNTQFVLNHLPVPSSAVLPEFSGGRGSRIPASYHTLQTWGV
jgi:hypothetical protein